METRPGNTAPEPELPPAPKKLRPVASLLAMAQLLGYPHTQFVIRIQICVCVYLTHFVVRFSHLRTALMASEANRLATLQYTASNSLEAEQWRQMQLACNKPTTTNLFTTVLYSFPFTALRGNPRGMKFSIQTCLGSIHRSFCTKRCLGGLAYINILS